jgi:hypothetical protein
MRKRLKMEDMYVVVSCTEVLPHCDESSNYQIDRSCVPGHRAVVDIRRHTQYSGYASNHQTDSSEGSRVSNKDINSVILKS